MPEVFSHRSSGRFRRFAGSRKYPHFNVEALADYLPESNIQYIQMLSLGGRRKPLPDSKNTVWRNEAFKGYANYTTSEEYNNAILELTALIGFGPLTCVQKQYGGVAIAL